MLGNKIRTSGQSYPAEGGSLRDCDLPQQDQLAKAFGWVQVPFRSARSGHSLSARGRVWNSLPCPRESVSHPLLREELGVHWPEGASGPHAHVPAGVGLSKASILGCAVCAEATNPARSTGFCKVCTPKAQPSRLKVTIGQVK
mmetsp:Transcript_138575/g.441994  ORF Transcript_138575/g.441994 Transcript_138575/m.441994 type:complete len:143 (+) Transcript_138575:82-510(+)